MSAPFDLAEHLRRWRQETEATLAFDDDEIDELEDHLQLMVEGAITDGVSPEQAWQRAIARLGSSSSLALEFAKSKLLPSLLHLLGSWWRPGLLLILFGIRFIAASTPEWPSLDQGPDGPHAVFWLTSWLSFIALLLLLPDKTPRTAVLLGVGNAFCLIPLLHPLAYNAFTEWVIGPYWSEMAASFGWLPISLSLIGLVLLNGWGWKRAQASRTDIPAMLSLAGAIVFLLAISPFCGELIGNLSVRDMYEMPTAAQVTLTGADRDHFLQWKFVDVLFDCVVRIATWLPLVLMVVGGVGTVLLQWAIRFLRTLQSGEEPIFPAARDLPWIMTYLASGACWVFAGPMVSTFKGQIFEMEKNVVHISSNHTGVAFMSLGSSLLFLIGGYELTNRLRHTFGLRYFYASILVVAEAIVLLGLVGLPALVAAMDPGSAQKDQSPVPVALQLILITALVVLIFRQIWLIRERTPNGLGKPSMWKFEGRDLMQFGLLLGLCIAGAWTILAMVAIVMAFESTSVIAAMIEWGTSIKDPLNHHFDPANYVNSDTHTSYPRPHLDFWIYGGLSYVSLCLAIGLGIAMALSGLEFIRFNGYRLYKARKANAWTPKTVAMNE